MKQLMDIIGDSHMVFLTAGMGGGTGTGATPAIANACKKRGILTVAIVTTPFSFEGLRRSDIATQGIQRLHDNVRRDLAPVICLKSCSDVFLASRSTQLSAYPIKSC
jgi:cell division GTPase FtsZ